MPLKRPVILDAANIAYCYADDKCYETKGILLAAQYFLKEGNKPYIVVHHSRTLEEKQETDMTPESKDLMLRLSEKSSDNILMQKGLVIPARKKGKLDDDEFILSLADQRGGFIISRDSFQKQGNDYPHWLTLIKFRVADFTFSFDVFYPRILQKNSLKCYDDDPEYEQIAKDQLTEVELLKATNFITNLLDSIGRENRSLKRDDQNKDCDKGATMETYNAVPDEPKSVQDVTTLTDQIQTFSMEAQTISQEYAGKNSFTQTDEKHDINRRKGTITFTVPNFEALRREGVGAEKYSQIEYYRGIPWYIYL